MFLEIGAEQTVAVNALAEQAGLQLYAVRTDLAGHDRCLILGKNDASCLILRTGQNNVVTSWLSDALSHISDLITSRIVSARTEFTALDFS